MLYVQDTDDLSSLCSDANIFFITLKVQIGDSLWPRMLTEPALIAAFILLVTKVRMKALQEGP